MLRGRLSGKSGNADDVTLLLEGQEIKSLVFNDRSADRKAEMVVAQFGIFDVGWRERRGCSIRLITVEVVSRTVKLIGARPEDDVDDTAGVTPTLGVRLGLGGKFVNRVQGHDRAGDAGDSALIHGRNVVPEIVVVDAVDLPVHLVGAGSIERTEAADRVSAVARLNGSELSKIAPVHWNVLNRLGGNDVALGGRGGVEGQRSSPDLHDRRTRPSSGQFHRKGGDAAGRNRNIVKGCRTKPCRRYFDLIRSQRQILEGELAVARGSGTDRDTGGRVGRLHGSPRDHRT